MILDATKRTTRNYRPLTRDQVTERIADAFGRLRLAGARITISAVAEASGVSRSTVWGRWAQLKQDSGAEPWEAAYAGLDAKDHDEIQRRVAAVRAAKAKDPDPCGLGWKTLAQILPD